MPQPLQSTHGSIKTMLLAAVAVAVAAAGVYLAQPSFIASTNNLALDAVMALAEVEPSASVVVVDIDEKSLSRYGQWPWSRDRLAQLLAAINASGPDSVGLDLILAEPDRTSPSNSRGTPGSPRWSQDHDRILAATLSRGPFVLGYQFLFAGGRQPAPGELHPPGIIRVKKTSRTGDSPPFFSAQGVVSNRGLFSASVKRSGFLNAAPDDDGVLRRVPMLIRLGDGLYPSLTLAMLMQHEKSGQVTVLQGSMGRVDLLVGERSLCVDQQGNLLLRFSRLPDQIARISAADILEGGIDRKLLVGKMVLVGSSAAGLEPTYQTSAGTLRSHTDIHAQLLDNLLTGARAIRSGESLLWEALAGVLAAMMVGIAVAVMGVAASATVALCIVAGCWGAAYLVFLEWGFLFSPLLPSCLVLLSYAGLTTLKSWQNQIVAREAADSTLVLLKSSEKSLDSIIKAVPDIIFRLDPAGRITFISPAITRYSTDSDALLGQPILDLVLPDDLPKARYRLNEKRTGERATRCLELRLLLPHHNAQGNEQVGYFSVSAEGLYQGNTPSPDQFIGTQGIIRDITEQKKLEETLLQAQKMEVIGRLAAGVAHDLNNILVGLVAYPDLLLLELPPESPLREKITLIQRSGQKAAAIVQDLLALGRRGTRASEIVDLNVVISDYLASLEFGAAWKNAPNVSLETNLAPDLLHIKGGKVNLAKVVMNILINAAEAMPAGGIIQLSTYNRYLDIPLHCYEEIPAGEYACLGVTDDGIGIAEEELHRIFEPFYSRKSMGRSGSGLGMTVIWTTIKDYGGFLDIRSKEGEGTRMVIYFPVTREQDGVCSRPFVLEDFLGTETVLVVDDVPEQLQIAGNMLSKLGYMVSSVASGEAAVEYLASHSCDLVILDMIMPGGMDGLETYRRILDIRPVQRAIITSGFSETERVRALQELGAGSYVEKPYTLEKIGVAVRRELDRQRQVESAPASECRTTNAQNH